MVPICEAPEERGQGRGLQRVLQEQVLSTTPTRCASSPAAPRAPRPTTRCCSSPARPRTTTTPRSTRRVWQLYASGVLIMEKCADLLPDYFSFVKGVVDSEDLSLNISRETLQKDSQLKLMRNSLEKKIKNELTRHARQRPREVRGPSGRTSAARSSSASTATTACTRTCWSDLLLFYSAKEKKLVTLDEYVEKPCPRSQKCIYFAAGDDTDRLGKLPNAQLVLSKGYDLLLLHRGCGRVLPADDARLQGEGV